MPARIAWYILGAALVLSAAGVAAQTVIEPVEAMAEWERGRRLMREGNHLDAARIFEQLTGQYSDSPSLPLFIFHRAKANYHGSEYVKAAAGFSLFLSRYPEAPEVPYAHFFLGNAVYHRGDADRALRDYLKAYRFSRDDRLTRLAHESIIALLNGGDAVSIAPADIMSIPQERRCPLVDDLEEVLLNRGQVTVAADLMASCGWGIDSTVMDRTAGYQDKDELIEVAVVLPLSGDLQEFGNEIYRGALIGATMYADATGRRVAVGPYDTEGYLIDAARLVGELSYGSTDAVIGPLTSEEAAVASARLHGSDLPLVIPAATEAGLTRLSETSFQLSPNIELQAVRMADYAVDVLGAQTAAVVAPTTAEHLRMAERFVERFGQRGGEVVATEYYRSRDRDFGRSILDIKATLLGVIPDSSFWLDNRGDTVDADGVAAEVDVLFLPGRAEQIRLLLPQIRFYNLRGRYLGSDGWGDEEIYRLGDDVTQLAVFPSPFLPTAPTEASVRFAAAYDERYGSKPERLARLGYDAMQLVLRAIERGDNSRREMVQALAGVRDYHGAAGRVSFGENRENVYMPLYRIVAGSAEPLVGEPVDSE